MFLFLFLMDYNGILIVISLEYYLIISKVRYKKSLKEKRKLKAKMNGFDQREEAPKESSK